MSIWVRLYEHIDYGGRSTFANLLRETPMPTYLRITKSWFDSVNLHDKVDSLEWGAGSDEEGGWIILFEHAGYRGRYARFEVESNKSDKRPDLYDVNLHDKTSNVLIVRRFSKSTGAMPFSNLGGGNLRLLIKAMVDEVSALSRRGEPTITWDMWPSFSPDRKFIYIRVPVEVDVPHWVDYDAEIRLWIYLYITEQGKLRGYVDWYGVEVERGSKSKKIADVMMGEIKKKIPDINSVINGFTSQTDNLGTFKRVYLLPGSGGQGTVESGHVEDDVSIVFVKQ